MCTILSLHWQIPLEYMAGETGFVDAESNSTLSASVSFSLQVLFALNQTLLQHEGVRAGSLQGSYTTEDLITHYNCGDLSSIIFNHDTSQVRPNFSCPDLHKYVLKQQNSPKAKIACTA